MTLTNLALGKWKRIECDLEAFFFFFFLQISFTFAVAPNMVQVKLVIIFYFYFAVTLVTNSLSQLLLHFQQHVS